MKTTGLALLAALVLAAAANAGPALDPVTQRYVDVLRPDLISVANASTAGHVPCFHSPKGLRDRNCWKLHAALQRATERTLADLANVEVPPKLAALDARLKSGLRAYLARIKSFRAHPERASGHSIDDGGLNNTIGAMARLLRTYLPLLG